MKELLDAIYRLTFVKVIKFDSSLKKILEQNIVSSYHCLLYHVDYMHAKV